MVAPLAGLKVLDIAKGIAAPFCAKLLGDLGADVTKCLSGNLARMGGTSVYEAPPVLAPNPNDPLTRREEDLFTLIPRKRTTTFDIRRAIALMADAGSVFEIDPLGPFSRFQIEEIIDPRDTRRLVCEWDENACRLVSQPDRLGPWAIQCRP